MEDEKIIREQRRWTRWIISPKIAQLGNLVVTNRRVLFLHKISSSPDVSANIKRLSNAPISDVLDYAFSLNPNNYQFPLSAIRKVRVRMFAMYPGPRFCLSITFADKRRQSYRTVDFQFISPGFKNLITPQLFKCIGWVSAVNRATK